MKNLELLSPLELIEITGGHDGLAYEFGKALGKAVIMAATFMAIFTPKS